MATKEEILESIAQMSVMDVADLIKMMEEKFGVVAAAVRAVTGLGLKEAKDLCENGGVIKEAVSKEEAASIKEKLEAAGCVVEVK